MSAGSQGALSDSSRSPAMDQRRLPLMGEPKPRAFVSRAVGRIPKLDGTLGLNDL